MTPHHQQLDKRKSATLSIASDGLYDSLREGGVMENLADELADAWDEDGTGEAGSSFLEGLREGSVEPSSLHDEIRNGNDFDHKENYTIRSPTAPSRRQATNDMIQSPTRSAGNVRRNTSKRDRANGLRPGGPDYGDFGDLDVVEGIPETLARKMGNIEALARRGLDDDSISEGEGIVPRTTIALQDLGAQASIENGATRMITAYTSMASHRTHKTRETSSLAQSLLLDRYPYLSEDEIEKVVSELDKLIRCLQPTAGTSPLQAIQMLVANTTDLAHSLRSLSDILQESRQAASAASRRLKNARDFVAELQEEEEAREEAIRYLEKGDWDQRIRSREAQRICGDVVTGFETTCDAWRYRLFGTLSMEVTPA
jgi:hypothetical protein